MPIDPTKLANLLVIANSGEKVQVCEYLKVTWLTTGPVVNYYAASAYHQTPPFTGIGLTIEPRLLGSEPFRQFEYQPDLKTETMKVVLDNIDKDLTAKFQTYKSGVTAELFYFYPQVDLHVSVWLGQLQAPEDYTHIDLETVVTNGFRSRETLVPGRDRSRECNGGQNFGGRLPTQIAIASNGCHYNRHLGGTNGLFKTGTTPFDDCPGFEPDCQARFGDVLTYLGFRVDAAAVVTDQSTGYLAKSKGNTSALKEPIRVIAGSKIVRACQQLLGRREVNQNDPPRGFIRGIWEVGEGPNQSISNIHLNGKLIEQIHIDIRLGNRREGRTNYAPDVSNFSKTGHFSAAFGWVDAAQTDPFSLSSQCNVHGYNLVHVYSDANAGNGLISNIYADIAFSNLFATRIDYEINYPSNSNPPISGIGANGPFSIKWNGSINARFTETYTFTVFHDDSVEVRINGVLIINQTTFGTHTGNSAMTADTPVAIEVKLAQQGNPPPNPWGCTLKWQSASQAQEIVPNSRLTHAGLPDGTFARQWSNDRIWWLLELYTNQAFGMQYSSPRFNIPTFKTTSVWGLQNIQFQYTTSDGEVKTYAGRRTTFDQILEGRPAAEQIIDVCRSGSAAIPFLNEGKFETRPISVGSASELTNARVFADRGQGRNIFWDGNKPILSVSQIPDDKVVNEITLTFEDGANADNERPVKIFDRNQKLIAGRSLGGNHLMTVAKKFVAFGIRDLQEVVRLGFRLIWFGEFDEGGIHNNYRVIFQTSFEHILGLKRYDIIKIDSALVDGFKFPNNEQIVYFRVLRMKKLSAGRAEVTTQAYNHTQYSAFETVTQTLVDPNPQPPVIEAPKGKTETLIFGSVTYDAANGQIVIPIN